MGVAGQSNAVDCTMPLGVPYPGCGTGLASFLVTEHRQIAGWAKSSMYLSAWDEGQQGWLALEAALRGHHNVTTVVWWQGEAEGATGQSDHYATRLHQLAARIRATVQRPDVEIIVMGLLDAPTPKGTIGDYREGYRKMRLEQQAFVAGDPHAQYVSTEGIPLNPANPFHLTAEGYQIAAVRILGGQ